MKRRTQQAIAAFVITVIVIAGLCGFVAVDLSTERYMPADYGPLFRVSSIGQDGVRFSALGEPYIIAAGQFGQAKELIWRCRGLLPTSTILAGNLTARGYLAVQAYLEQQEQEIW